MPKWRLLLEKPVGRPWDSQNRWRSSASVYFRRASCVRSGELTEFDHFEEQKHSDPSENFRQEEPNSMKRPHDLRTHAE